MHNTLRLPRNHMAKTKTVVNTKGKRPKGRNVGKLMQVMNVPMDVFFEIVSHLDPLDVLQLSRVSNELRSMLQSKDSRHIWIAARKNISPPLPDCPTDMSEPLYAYLVFERFCQLCGAGRAMNVDYALRVRLCAICWPKNVRKGRPLVRELGLTNTKKNKSITDVLFTLVPEATREWTAREPLQQLDQQASSSFYSPQFLPVGREYLALRDTNQQAVQTFVEEHQAEALIRRNDSSPMGDARGTEQDKQGREVMSERAAEIQKRLEELGYDESEFRKQRNFEWTQMLDQPRQLTPRIWNTIRPRLIAILDNGRAQREADAFRVKWAKRREALKKYYVAFLQRDRMTLEKRTMPGFEDAKELPCMLSLLTAAEPEVDLPQEQFSAIESTLLIEAERYRVTVRRHLARVIKQSDPEYMRSHSVAMPPLKRRKTGRSTSGRKGKQRATSEDDSDEDSELGPDEELALLEDPKSLFRLSLPGRYDTLNIDMSYLALLECWQGDRAAWNIQHVQVMRFRGHESYAQLVPRFLAAVGVDGDTTHSELDVLVRSGRPKCSCGKDPVPMFGNEGQYLVMGKLVRVFRIDSFDKARCSVCGLC
ncbi:hypothetical protein C8Q74DRAFT_1248954 [Fomes fomentarius]|nr:hypothetical protein C8Q74DRAFT_1248954 [Fomes fomentarius]